jgi:hypothetical protein
MDKNHEVITALFVITRKHKADKIRFGAATRQEMLRVCIHNTEGHEAGEKSELLKNAVIALVPSQPEIAPVSSVSSFLGKNGVIS